MVPPCAFSSFASAAVDPHPDIPSFRRHYCHHRHCSLTSPSFPFHFPPPSPPPPPTPRHTRPSYRRRLGRSRPCRRSRIPLSPPFHDRDSCRDDNVGTNGGIPCVWRFGPHRATRRGCRNGSSWFGRCRSISSRGRHSHLRSTYLFLRGDSPFSTQRPCLSQSRPPSSQAIDNTMSYFMKRSNNYPM